VGPTLLRRGGQAYPIRQTMVVSGINHRQPVFENVLERARRYSV